MGSINLWWPIDAIGCRLFGRRFKGIKFEFANCGAYKLDMNIFNEPIIYGSTGEEWLSSMVGSMAKRNKIKIIRATKWFPIAAVEDLKRAEKFLK